jgi:hypothetical protein
VNRLDFWPSREAITVDYSAGGVIEVPGPDGTILKLRKIDTSYDPSNRINATTPHRAGPQEGRRY